MELINLEQTLTHDLSEVVVSHASTTLERGLEPGESVVLCGEDGRLRSAHVADLRFTAEDTLYVIAVGAPLPAPADHARDERPAGRTSVDDVVDLLEDLRRQRQIQRGPSDPLARILTRV